MVLSREQLEKIKHVYGFLDDDAEREAMQPNGVDLSVEKVFEFRSRGYLGVDINAPSEYREMPTEVDPEEYWLLPPGAYAVRFSETIDLPDDVMAYLWPRSSLLRSGVSLQTAVWDAGYTGKGQSLLVVHNPYGYRLERVE